MGSEKSDVRGTVVVFDSLADAERRVAGVAAAARIARDCAQSGQSRIWLAVPGGGPFGRETNGDLERLAAHADVETWKAEQLGDLLEEVGPESLTVLAATIPLAADILRATGKASDGPVAKSLNRPLSRRLSALFLRNAGFRPIHATFGTALIATFMFIALLAGGGPGLIAGGLLFHFASIFDGVDGEVARATFRTSSAGAVLDSAIDAATNGLFILGVTLNLAARGNPNAAALGVWGLALLATGLLAIGWRTAHSDTPFGFDLLKQHFGGRSRGRFAPFIVGFVTTVTSRDFFAFLFALLIVAGRPMAVLYIFAAAATVWIMIVAAAFVPAGRQRSA